MSNTVKRFPIPDFPTPPPALIKVEMPMGAQVLSAQVVVAGFSTISVSALVDLSMPTVFRLFDVVADDGKTGSLPRQFVDTVTLPSGIRFHVFDRGETCCDPDARPCC